MANPRIAEYWKATQIKKWETRNPNWQPRKWISLVNKELQDKWYPPARKQDIEENYMQILQLEEEELKAIINDKNKPMLVRIICKNILSWKWFDVIERMLDRWIWKATQKEEIKADINHKVTIEI